MVSFETGPIARRSHGVTALLPRLARAPCGFRVCASPGPTRLVIRWRATRGICGLPGLPGQSPVAPDAFSDTAAGISRRVFPAMLPCPLSLAQASEKVLETGLLDKQKLRPFAESRKRFFQKFSTGGGFAVDKFAATRQRAGFSAIQRGNFIPRAGDRPAPAPAPALLPGRYCRSRCASSRSRRALSLMKPAASFWS